MYSRISNAKYMFIFGPENLLVKSLASYHHRDLAVDFEKCRVITSKLTSKGLKWHFGPLLPTWFVESQHGKVITCRLKFWMNLLIHSQASMAAPLTVDNG